jgi:NADH-quinone oxidoreductase subunit A
LRGTLRCDRPAAVRFASREGIVSRRGATPGGSPPFVKASEGSVPSLISDYLPLVVFIALSGLIGAALLIAPFIVAYKNPDPEKLSAYECGFNPFDDARMKFDVRFYLVSLLFIIFDLEVAFLFPWAAAFHDIGVFGFWSMILFLAVLTIGFVYEWNKGALEWD